MVIKDQTRGPGQPSRPGGRARQRSGPGRSWAKEPSGARARVVRQSSRARRTAGMPYSRARSATTGKMRGWRWRLRWLFRCQTRRPASRTTSIWAASSRRISGSSRVAKSSASRWPRGRWRKTPGSPPDGALPRRGRTARPWIRVRWTPRQRPGRVPGQAQGRLGPGAGGHQAGAREQPLAVGQNHRAVQGVGEPEVVGGEDNGFVRPGGMHSRSSGA